MSKHIRLGFLVLIGVAIGWFAGTLFTSPVLAQPAGTASSNSAAHKYAMRAAFTEEGYQAFRIDCNSGESWQESDNKLARLTDDNPIPAGDYELSLASMGKLYTAHRIDQKSGRMWRISGTQWLELTPVK